MCFVCFLWCYTIPVHIAGKKMIYVLHHFFILAFEFYYGLILYDIFVFNSKSKNLQPVFHLKNSFAFIT